MGRGVREASSLQFYFHDPKTLNNKQTRKLKQRGLNEKGGSGVGTIIGGSVPNKGAFSPSENTAFDHL